MSEYIDRELVLQTLDWHEHEMTECDYVFPPLIEDIKNIPAADVRPVVTCEKCIYAYPYGLEIKCTKHSGRAERFGEDASYSEFHDLNWFCADAQER